tara:strand:- start:688 stop:957 length:270 start_codon:yes stop_codon:yes gene_type:complete
MAGETDVINTKLLTDSEPISNARLNQLMDFVVTVQTNSIDDTRIKQGAYEKIFLKPKQYADNAAAVAGGVPTGCIYYNTTSSTLALVTQ